MQARRVRRLVAVAAVAVTAAAASLAGGTSPAAGAAGDPTTFTVGIKQDLDSLNPFTGIVSSAYEMYQMNYDTLTDYAAKDFSAQPALAESWDTSEDGLTWTYHLRPG
jgi:peptide/nickel transport system substrate-binding protein